MGHKSITTFGTPKLSSYLQKSRIILTPYQGADNINRRIKLISHFELEIVQTQIIHNNKR